MRLRPIDCILASAMFAFVLAGPASAMGPEPANPNPPQGTKSAPKQDNTKTSTTPDQKKKKTKKDQQSLLESQEFRIAYDQIYTAHDYAAGIASLLALKQDDHPDVANLIGYSSRKLGRYDDSKIWYERALAADPKHARTWSYYGMWHAEQGNLLKAKDYLTRVASICGTGCKEYTELKGVIEGTRTY
jgi:tetratricopeptide (TPR) repeat protein